MRTSSGEKFRDRGGHGALAWSFSTRTIAYAVGIELPFNVLVPLIYVKLLALDQPSTLGRAVTLIGFLWALKTLVVIALLAWMLRPIERWCEASAGGSRPVDAELLRRAGRAAYQLPQRFALLWALTWGLMYFPVTAVFQSLPSAPIPPGARATIATALFSLACFAAALPLGYSILATRLLAVTGQISLAARSRGVTLPGEGPSLRARLVAFALCLGTAPTSLMASLIVSPTSGPMSRGHWVTLAFFAFVPLLWAPLAAAFLAQVVASPFRLVGTAIEQIIRRGDVDTLARLPVHFKDEIGKLASGVNSMVDRLQETSAEVRAYVAERERLRVDAARRASQLQTVLDHIVEAVFACDAEGRLTLVNASGLRLLGLARVPDRIQCGLLESRYPLLGDGGMLERLRHQDGRPFAHGELPLTRALQGEKVVQEAQVYSHPETQRDVFLLTSAAPIRGDAGAAILGAVAVARDVTEPMQLAQMKEQFIKVAAHELKTPVTVMKGYSLALLRGATDLPPARRTMLEAVNRGADRINRIVEDILAVSQAVLDLPTLSSERVDVRKLVESGIAALPDGARCRVRLSTVGPVPLLVLGDARGLGQAFANLLDNALKYSPQGGDIEVEVTVTQPPDGLGEAMVSIHDHGVGIPADKQGHIFELFFRAHTDTPHDYGGLGVGLYLAKAMIARHGGHLWFESEEGRGATFHFTVPLHLDFHGHEPRRA